MFTSSTWRVGLERAADVTVHCWGDERRPIPCGPAVRAYRPWDALAGSEPYAAALQALSIDLTMALGVAGADLVHSHTWYANLGGHLAKLIHAIPHVATVHSLEPMRPWKREQLAGGYALSSFAEKTALEAADAIIAVSAAHLAEILACYPAVDPALTNVIYNGIDADEYRPGTGGEALDRHGIDPSRPSVVFVGRITRQKGLAHLLDAAPAIDPGAQLVLCAGAPDTPEIAAEIAAKVEAVSASRGERALDRGDAAEGRGDPDPRPGDGVCLSVCLRADGDRQPGGDGLRDRRCRDRGRWHSGGRRGRRDGPARSLRGAPRRNRHAGRPGRPGGGSRGAHQRAPRRSGPRRRQWGAQVALAPSTASAGTSPRGRRWRSTSGCLDRLAP